MIPISKALKIIDAEVPALKAERVDIGNALGRILAADVKADSDLPPFDRSQMDGYAVIADDTLRAPVKLKVVGESAAGHGWHKRISSGEAVRIMTGAPLPPGADAVQRLELAREVGGVVELLEPTKKGRFIVYKGSETQLGSTVLRTGDLVTENNLSVLAAFGHARVAVFKRPRVAILGTGSEIVEIGKRPARDQIRNSNSVMLAAMCSRHNAEAAILPNAPDDIEALKATIKAAAKGSEVLVMTGGVSVGKYDHTKAALAELGAEIFFEKIRLKPGKPAVFARYKKTLIFGLPGNPVSTAVTFHLFVRRALLKLQSATRVDLRAENAVLGCDVKAADARDSYLPSITSTDPDGRLIATSLKWHGSSDFIGFSAADSLIIIPAGTSKKAGEVVKIALL